MKTIVIFPALLFALACGVQAQESWVTQNSGFTTILHSVDFVDSNTGWIDGGLKTTNGGATWTYLASGGGEAEDFIDANAGYCAGTDGHISKTTNGGTNWTVNNSFLGSASFNAVHFANTNVGWIAGGSPPSPAYILKTTNGGTNWTSQSFSAISTLKSIHFVDANTGWAVGTIANTGGGAVLKTTNAGVSWFSQADSAVNGLSSVYFVNANTGWAVSGYGQMIKTTNGGTTWVTQYSSTIYGFNSVQFLDLNTGYAVGGSIGNIILKTTNGGTNWAIQFRDSVATHSLSCVHFVDATHGWAVGTKGVILKHIGIPVSVLPNKLSTEYFGISNSGQLCYQVPYSSQVSVLLFDPNGRLKLKLFDGYQMAGNHALPLPAQLPGVRLLDLRIGDFHKAIALSGQK